MEISFLINPLGAATNAMNILRWGVWLFHFPSKMLRYAPRSANMLDAYIYINYIKRVDNVLKVYVHTMSIHFAGF